VQTRRIMNPASETLTLFDDAELEGPADQEIAAMHAGHSIANRPAVLAADVRRQSMAVPAAAPPWPRPRSAHPPTRRDTSHHPRNETLRTHQSGGGPGRSTFVDAEPVRRHVGALIDAGLSVRRIQILAAVNRKTLQSLMSGRPERGSGPTRLMRAETAGRILDIPVPHSPQLLAAACGAVPAIGATRRLQALVALAHSQTDLCERLGILPSNATALFSGRRRTVRPDTAQKVAALFDELRTVNGTNVRAHRRAQRRGWAPPSAWDDNTIDDPAALLNIGRHIQAAPNPSGDSLFWAFPFRPPKAAAAPAMRTVQ
jgi:hypothetical protein